MTYRQLWVILYLINIIFALSCLIPLSSFLQDTLAHSLENRQLLAGFDYIFIQDFLSEYGLGVAAIFDQSMLAMLLYFLLSIFLMGGVLHLFQEGRSFSRVAFLEACSQYFWRLLRLTIYFLMLHIVLLGTFVLLFLRMTNGGSPFAMESDTVVITALQVTAPIYLLLSAILFMIQDYAKIHVIQADSRFLFRPFWQSFRIVFQHFWPFLSFYLLVLFSFGVLFGLYRLLGLGLEADTKGLILLLFFFSQILIFLRMGLRLLHLGGATLLYQERSTRT